jgi:hypothetical protein
MQHHQVECPLVVSYLSVIARMFNRKEVFIECNVEFSSENLLGSNAWLSRNFSRTSHASVPAPFIKASNTSRSVPRFVLAR